MACPGCRAGCYVGSGICTKISPNCSPIGTEPSAMQLSRHGRLTCSPVFWSVNPLSCAAWRQRRKTQARIGSTYNGAATVPPLTTGGNWNSTHMRRSGYDVGAPRPTCDSSNCGVVLVTSAGAGSSHASENVSRDASASWVPTDISQFEGRVLIADLI